MTAIRRTKPTAGELVRQLLICAIALCGPRALPALAQQNSPTCAVDDAIWLAESADSSKLGAANVPRRREGQASGRDLPWLACRLKGPARELRIEAKTTGASDPSI